MRKWLVIAGIVWSADQLTKYLAEQWLVMNSPIPILPSFNLTLVYNTGAAFSLLSQAGGWQRWFFVIITLAVCAVLISWLRKLEADDHLTGVGASLILGGALGNLSDRLLYGHVIDFLDVYYNQYHWPVFNIADTCISIGALLVVTAALTDKKPKVY